MTIRSLSASSITTMRWTRTSPRTLSSDFEIFQTTQEANNSVQTRLNQAKLFQRSNRAILCLSDESPDMSSTGNDQTRFDTPSGLGLYLL